jgi:Fe2+ or Zn2+ uptake regulation protein
METTEQRLSWARDYCERIGLRRTPVRERVLAFLADQRLPVTWTAVAESRELKGCCDPATVYRSLNLFADAGLICAIRLFSKVTYFVLNVPGELFEYFVCMCCGQISGTASKNLHDALLLQSIDSRDSERENRGMVLFGLCERCRTPTQQAVPTVKIISRAKAHSGKIVSNETLP